MDLFSPIEIQRLESGEIAPESLPELAEMAKDAAKGHLTWGAYDKTVEIAHDLAPHVFGKKPVELIGKQRPNEPKDVLSYRLEVWEPETRAFFGRFLNVVSRMGSPTAYDIIHPEAPIAVGDDTLEEYAGNSYGNYDSIPAFTFEVLLEWLFGDPNAVLCIFDPMISLDGVQDGERPKPKPFIYPAENVVYKRERKEYLIETDFKSWVSVGDEKRQEGLMYLYIDTYGIYIVSQYGERGEYNFQVGFWQRHYLPPSIGTPAITLGGDLKCKGMMKWYESFIQPAVADWNKYIIRVSDLDAWFVRTLYPPQIIAAAECEVCRQSDRKGQVKDLEGHYHTCEACNGTGQSMIGFGPFATYHVDPDKTTLKPQDAIHYPSIDTGLYDPASKNISTYERKGFQAINMEMLSNTGTNQSGVAKDIDRKPLEDFLMRIAKRVFFLIEWQYKVVAYSRYGGQMAMQPQLGADFVEDMLPDVKPPHTLSYGTLGMLFNDLEKSTQAGASHSLIRAENVQIAARKYGTDTTEYKRIEAETRIDPYYGWNADDLLALGAVGSTNALWTYVHANIKQLVDMAIFANPDFLELPHEEQSEIVFGIAETEKAASTPTPGPALEIPPTE